MRVVFVAIGAEQLGIGTLSAILRRAGHDTRLVFNPALFEDRYNLDVPILKDVFRRDARILADILDLEPDVLAVSPLTVTYKWTLGVLREVKRVRPETHVVVGGVHASAVPHVVVAEPCVDAIVVGEGDVAFPAYLEARGRGGPSAALPNVWFKGQGGAVVKGPNAPFEQGLDALPFVDKELFEDFVDIEANYLCMTSRGCPYRCTFCFNNFWATLPDGDGGKFVRHRSPDHVLAELRWAKRRYGMRHIEFTDDVFTVNHKWLATFLEGYCREIGVPFACLTHAKYVTDDVARVLAEAGCENVQMGIQSMDEDFRRKELKRVEKAKDVDRALSALEKHGVRFTLDHIFGFPGEAPAAQDAAYALYSRFRPHRVNSFYLTYYPGTQILREAVEAGRVSAAEADRIEHGDTVSYHQPQGGDRAGVARAMRFELLFKAIPLLGRLPARVLSERVAARVPRPLLRAGILAADLASAVKTRNEDFRIYLRWYAREMARAALPRRRVRPKARENPSLATPPPALRPAMHRSLVVTS